MHQWSHNKFFSHSLIHILQLFFLRLRSPTPLQMIGMSVPLLLFTCIWCGQAISLTWNGSFVVQNGPPQIFPKLRAAMVHGPAMGTVPPISPMSHLSSLCYPSLPSRLTLRKWTKEDDHASFCPRSQSESGNPVTGCGSGRSRDGEVRPGLS